MRLIILLPALLLTAACAQRGDLSDPAYGGFFNGIENIADGTYDERIATREERVVALQARQQRLLAERNSLSRQISAHENELARLRHDIVVAKVTAAPGSIDPATISQIEFTMARQPTGDTQAERLASLQETIADTRKLAERLANLAG